MALYQNRVSIGQESSIYTSCEPGKHHGARRLRKSQCRTKLSLVHTDRVRVLPLECRYLQAGHTMSPNPNLIRSMQRTYIPIKDTNSDDWSKRPEHIPEKEVREFENAMECVSVITSNRRRFTIV